MLFLDGYSLSIEDLIQIGLGKYRVQLSEEAIYRVKKSREVVDGIVEGDKGTVLYGSSCLLLISNLICSCLWY